MPSLSFDWTIQLSDLLIFAGGVIASVRIFTSMRDNLRDVVAAVSGLRKDVDELDLGYHRHHDWLIELRAARKGKLG